MTLQQRLIRIIMATTVSALLLTVALTLASAFFILRQDLKRDVTGLAAAFGDNATAPLVFHVPEDAERLLDALSNVPSIEVAAVYDDEGSRFATYQRESGLEVPDVLDAVNSRSSSLWLVEVQRPIRQEQRQVGTIYVRSDLSAIGMAGLLIATVSVLVMSVAVLGAFLLSSLLQKRVSNPILKLAHSVRRITKQQDYTIRVSGTGAEEEIQNLYDSFNVMLGQLHQREQQRDEAEAELSEHRAHLEEVVEQRTAELARSNQDLEQFAYAASHDLQEPLRTVTSFTQLLADRYRGKLDSDADEFIQFAVEGALRGRRLIEGLLAYSRINTRGLEVEPTDCDELLKEVLRDLEVKISDRGASVSHDPLPTVSADWTQLGRVFQNLIANALKFCGGETPRVHVGFEQVNGQSVFSVSDNGPGIEPQYFERVFKIFQVLERDPNEGTGMGLAICKRIVERHGGRIWVESQPGEGATFLFTIAA